MNRVFCLVVWGLILGSPVRSHAEEFSSRAEALPFPPDAREVNFHDTFDLIRFNSGSSLSAVTDFYRRELPKRGWIEDKSAVEQDDDSIDMTFNHPGKAAEGNAAQIVVELDTNSSGVSAYFECEGLEFNGLNDPAKLVAAGVPQPRSLLFLQKEIPRPDKIQKLDYSNDSCTFKSALTLTELFDYYTKALPAAGWRETRKPLITDDRRYTEYERHGEEVTVNVFTDEAGSRIVLRYESEKQEPFVPPLDEVGPLANSGKTPAANDKPAPPRVVVDVSRNTGTANIVLDGKKYTFKHAAAFRTKQDGDATTQLLFTDRPIPLARIQELLVTQDDASIDDIFGENWPSYIRINAGEYTSFSFNSGGVGVGNSIDEPVNNLKFDKRRVTGTLKTGKPLEVFDDVMTIEVSIDAPLLTPITTIGK